MSKRLIAVLFLIFSLTPHFLAAQVIPAFTIVYQNPNCSPELVTFQNTSTGAGILSFEWNFGVNPGVNSTQTNPSTTYSQCGSYTATLTVTNGIVSATITQQVIINCKPTASFTVTPSSGCPPLTVQFQSNSTAGTGSISSYMWDFGDGSAPGNGPNPSHVYSTTGCKTVTLVVINSNGCSDDTTFANVVCVNPPPVAGFTSNPNPAISCTTPFSVNFNGTATGGQSPYTFQWAFQGGAPSASSLQNPSGISFSSNGFHSVTLTVTDASGCKDTVSMSQYVFVGNFTTNFSLSAISGCTPFTVGVNASPVGAQSYVWAATGSTTPTGSGQSTSFTYNSPGSYSLCLTTTSATGCVASKCTTITVNATPTANFTSTGNNPNACQAPLTVHYQNTSTPGSSLSWSFPGGSPASSTASSPFVTYNQCGNYSATLTATNGGCSNSITQNNYVNINCPNALFTATPTMGCLPVTVQFNSAASQGNPVQWKWNFGNTGNANTVQSTSQNPTFTYTVPGCYDVRLIIYNSLGCSDTLLQNQLICVGTPPVANFNLNPPIACANVPIVFSSTSTGVFNYTTYNWSFGDGGTSSQANPNHLYSDTGMFSVTLVVCNFGCCDTVVHNNAVYIYPPIAQINVTMYCDTPYLYRFSGTGSLGANTYQWTFPNAIPASSTSPTPTVHFLSSGNFTVTLVVTNFQTGCSNTATKLVKPRNMINNFTIPLTACAPHTLSIINNCVDVNFYDWRVKNSAGTTIYSSTLANPPPFILTLPGSYTVQSITRDANNCRDTVIKGITVYGMNINISAMPNNVCAPVAVLFNDLSTSPNSSSVSWLWNFGDPISGSANTSTLQNPTHYYTSGGNYTISLSITDNHGCVSTKSFPGFLTLFQPVADFIASDTTICPGTTVCFINQSSGNGITFQWNFGMPPGSTLSNPCFMYPITGSFTVSLVVTDILGCRDTLVKPNYIISTDIVANFSADTTTSSCPPLPVHFTNLSTGVDASTIYFWDFGDGANSNLANPFHIYNVAGTYNVTLIATSGSGCSNTITFPHLIVIGGPVAQVITQPQTGCVPLTACFHAINSTSVSYIWDFGEGTISINNVDSICFTYNSSGIFFPQVILSNGLGCTYAFPFDSIIVGNPVAGFIPDHQDLCLNGNVQFTDTSYCPVAITSYSWDFGDPASGINNTSSNPNPSHFYSSLGNYTVTLILASITGCYDTTSVVIHVTPPPVANFTAFPTSTCQGLPVVFSDTSGSSSLINQWVWDFGDPASGVNNFSSLQNPTHIFIAPGNHIVTLIVISVNACSDTVTHQINIFNATNASAGPDAAACLGDFVQLNASGGLSYLWAPAALLNNASLANPIALTLSDTTFIVQVTDANGCLDMDTMTVTINPLPAVVCTPDDSVCMGGSITISANGANNYDWLPTTWLNNSHIQSPIATPQQSITYYATGTDLNGCKNTDSVLIHVMPNPVSDAGIGSNICFGDSVQLQGSGGISYLWLPGNGFNNTVPDPFVSPATTTEYFLMVTDLFGCINIDSVIVVVHQTPVVSAGADDTVCLGNILQLHATGGTMYLWSPTTFLSNPNISSPTSSPANDIQYSVIVHDQFGCVNYDTMNIHVILPFVGAISPDTMMCIGEHTQLLASGGLSYHWWPITGLSNQNIANPVASPEFSIQYFVSISDNQCFKDTQSVYITIFPLPLVDAGPDYTILAGEEVIINATASNGVSYSWTPVEGLDCPSCEDPVSTPASTIRYFLDVEDQNHCRTRDSMQIIVVCEDGVIYIPNAFTPDGNGKNDVFRIRSTGLSQLNYLRVFDRWGQLVFETNNIDEGWDGTFKDILMAPAVFVYYLEGVCTNGGVIKLQGNVTLIR